MDSPSRTILIIEDEPGHAAAIMRAFAGERPQDAVRVVASLQEGRAALEDQPPDIVLCDMELPDGRAFDLLGGENIKDAFPVIVMTSFGNETIAVEAMKAGAADYVVKSPEAFNDMPRMVARVMREWGLQQQARRAEEELRVSQEELAAIYDGTPVMMFVVDGERRLLNANCAFYNAVSVDGSQHRACGLMGCVNAADDPRGCGFGSGCAECALRIAMDDTLRTSRRHVDIETELTLQREGTGHKVAFLGSITPLPPKHGTPRALVSLLDITERRDAEEKLRENEEKISSILNAMEDAIISFSLVNNSISYSSPSCKRIFGRDIEREFSREGHEWVSCIHPDDIELVYEATSQIDEHDAVEFECRIVRPDSSIVWVQARQKVFHDQATGCAQRFDLMLADITKRKRAEESLRESEALLSRSQQVAHIGSWQFDVAAGQMVWSDELYRVLGLSPDKHPPSYKTFFEIVHPDDMPRAQESFSDFFNGDHDSLEYVHRIIRRDTDEVRYVYERCVHERDADGTIVRSIGMIQDITERRQAEEKAAEHLKELEQWYRVTLNREDRVLELKEEVNSLLARLGEQAKYAQEDQS